MTTGLEDSHFADRDDFYMDGGYPDPNLQAGTAEDHICFQRLEAGSHHDPWMTFQALSSVVSMEKKVVLFRPCGSIWNTEASVIGNSGILNPKDQNDKEKWRNGKNNNKNK